jgi:hypothetical protein
MEILILIAIMVFLFLVYSYKNKENFSYCSDCNHKSYNKCINCTNCGICITNDGSKYCEHGDANGPFNRKDCYIWHHGWRNQYPAQIKSKKIKKFL